MKKDAFLTVPNLITILGFIFIVLFVDNFLDGSQATAFLFLFLAGFSDALDGFLARRLKQESFIGSILDPVRDRTIMLALLYAFWCMRGSTNLILIIIFVEVLVFLIWAYQIFWVNYFYISTRHIFGKFRQAGHLACGGLGVLGLINSNQALGGMIVFSVILLGVIVTEGILKKFLSFFNLKILLDEGGMNGL